MNIKKAVTYFKNYFKIQKSNKGWYRMKDPFDNHLDRSMAVNFNLDKVVGFRSGLSCTIRYFIKEYEKLGSGKETENFIEQFSESDYIKLEEENAEPVKYNNVAKYPEHYLPFDVKNKLIANYVESRGFDYDYLQEKGFGYCLDGHFAFSLIIPFYVNDKLVYWQARKVLKYNIPKYLFPGGDYCTVTKSNLFYNQDELKWENKIYLAEGWADAEMFVGGVASCGWKLSFNQWDILKCNFKNINELIVVSDKGWYAKQVEQFLPICDYVKIKVLNLDSASFKDANAGGADAIFKIEDQTEYLSIMDLIKII